MDQQNTSLTLLHEAQAGNNFAWQRLAKLYEPLIAGWARRHAAVPEDVEDLAQEILLQVFRHLQQFKHQGRRGAFRSWLRTVAVHTTRDFWRARQRQLRGTGDSDFQAMLQELEDSSSGLAQAWDREH